MDLDDWTTLRELDTACGQLKGSAFRCFKRLLPTLREDRDYRVIDTQTDADAAERLRQAGRIYAQSVKLILLAPPVAARIRAQLSGPAA